VEPVILVCAPFFSVVRPALGISLLKAALRERDIPCAIRYLNLEFADEIGPGFHESAATGAANTFLVGEWIFAPLVNQHTVPSMDERYRQELKRLYSAAHLEQLEGIRAAARSFVEVQAQRLAEACPLIVGFTSSFQQNCASLAIARRLRELNPDIVVCFGGANCEGPMGKALLEAYPQIDYVFSGEADRTFPDFAECLVERRTYRSREGVLSRNSGSQHPLPILSAGVAGSDRIKDLDALPYPDFSDYFETLRGTAYHRRVNPALVFESSRGCWWGAKKHCNFCGLNGGQMAYRTKSATRVLAEIESLSGTYSTRNFLAADNIMDMKHIETVFASLTPRDDGPRFFYELKSNLSRRHLETLARAGVNWIQPGIESLDDDLLHAMQKGVTALQNIAVLRNCIELGMRATWTILYGFPEETAEQYRRMRDLAPLLEHLEPPNGCVPIRLDRFSPYFERARDFGFRDVKPVWAYSGVYTLPDETLANLAYYFEDRAGEPISYVDDLAARVENWNRSWMLAPEPPVLRSSDFGFALRIEDTRSCSVQRWRCIQGLDSLTLRAFREPRSIRAVLSELGPPAAEAFDRLISWQYLLKDKDRALSLVAEAGPLTAKRPDVAAFPGGFLLPPESISEARTIEKAVGI
jgi:ribosomal peptide maturation radical SAM protein 1